MTVLDNLVLAHCVMPQFEAAMTLSYYAEKPLSQHPGGIYRDQHDVLWLLKWLDPPRAVREVAACQLYRAIISSDAAAETLLLITEDNLHSGKWLVASRWVENLKTLQTSTKGFEEAIIASFLIGDKDAAERNFAEYSDHAFRYDFEEALQIPENEPSDWLPVPNLYLILSVIHFEAFDIPIDLRKLREVIHKITLPDIDWSFWTDQYRKALGLSLKAQSVEAFSQQTKRIRKRLSYLRFEFSETFNMENLSYFDFKLHEALLHYYRELMSYLRPLSQDTVTQLAANHLKYRQEYGIHPSYYQVFKKHIEEKAGLLELYINLRMKVNLERTENQFFLAMARRMKAIEAVEAGFQAQNSDLTRDHEAIKAHAFFNVKEEKTSSEAIPSLSSVDLKC